jgi:FkbM family methyltransferase
MEIESITELDLFIPFRERKQVVSMRDLSKLEGKIRAIPWLYFKLRKLVPYLNIFFSVERDFIALRLLDFSERSGIAVDVGFNDGISSVSIIKNSNLRVIAFEPLKIEMNKLIKLYLRNIEIYQVGLGEKSERLDIYVPSYQGKQMFPYASTNQEVLKTNVSRDLSIGVHEIFISKKEIEILTLDSYNLEVSFLKIDTEGTELQVLKGSFKTISRHHPYILIEIAAQSNFEEIHGYLREWGYVPYCFHNWKFTKAPNWDSGTRNYWFFSADPG